MNSEFVVKENAARKLAYLEKFGKDDKTTYNSSQSMYHHCNSPLKSLFQELLLKLQF